MIYILLALFGIKHFLADFVFQYDYMVQEKGIYGAMGGIHHSLYHFMFTLFILLFVTGNLYIALGSALVDGVLHYHIDWAKQQLNRGLTPADRKFWLYLGLDQCLHYLTYILLIFIVVR